MEGERHIFEIILTDCFVVDLHIVEDGLLIRKMVVVLHLRVVQGTVIRHVFLLFVFFVILFTFQFFGTRTGLVLLIVFQIVG